jgi:mono/diheme cytochrome c family protein
MDLAAIVAFLWLAYGTPETRGAPTEPVAEPRAVAEGKLLYGIYCQSCHGDGGRGDGPTAGSFQPPPADLTRLSRDNGGKFPLARVMLSIDGRSRIPGHRPGRMPIFGLTLQQSDADTNQEAEVREKIERLIDYLKSLQEPRR